MCGMDVHIEIDAARVCIDTRQSKFASIRNHCREITKLEYLFSNTMHARALHDIDLSCACVFALACKAENEMKKKRL